MHTDLDSKVSTLLANHAELQSLIQSAQFNQFDADTQWSLLKVHEEVDAAMNSINARVDALDLKIADLLSCLKL